MKNVMTRAWEIAREAVEKFGGKVKEFFAQALVIAWAERKDTLKEIIINVKGVSAKQEKYAKDLASEFARAYRKQMASVVLADATKLALANQSIDLINRYFATTSAKEVIDMMIKTERNDRQTFGEIYKVMKNK